MGLGLNLLTLIADACDRLLAAGSPTIDVIGIRMVLGLATIIMVWFGVQEALGQHFSMARFLNFFMLISFAYMFVNFYDTPIPGIGYSLTGWIKQSTGSLVDIIGADSTNTMLNQIGTTLSKQGPNMTFMTSPYAVLVYWSTQLMLIILSGLTIAVIGYGAIVATVIGMLGPIFIPFLVFEKTESFFWSWLKAYISFEFYKVVAACVMYVMGNVFVAYYQNFADFRDVGNMLENFPILLMMVTVNIFVILKIPAVTYSLFSGGSGGHDAGMGMAALVLRS